MKKEIGKIFNSSITVFDEDNILEEMIEAREGTVFVLGTRRIWAEGEPEDDNQVEITFAQIKKIVSN